MHQILAPTEAETVEQQGKHLKMIVLFVTHHINHAVDGIILETEFGGADILSHIHRCAVAAEQQLLVQTGVGKVGPYRTILLAEHYAFLKPFEHL